MTARQCVLLLVGLLAKRKAGQGYLVETQMALFYHGLTHHLRDSKDLEGDLRYMADLLTALHQHSPSLSMLMNCLTINLLIPNISDLPFLLGFLSLWKKTLEEHQELPTSVSLLLRTVVFRILGKLLF